MKKMHRILAMMTAGVMGLSIAATAQGSSGTTTTTTAKKPASVGARQVRQQKRIAQGVNSGQLTAGETARLERKEAALQNEKKNMKADGSLSPQEKAKLEHRENRLSKEIHRQKHDAQKRGKH